MNVQTPSRDPQTHLRPKKPPMLLHLGAGQLTATCGTPAFGIVGQRTTVTFEAPLQGIYTIS